MIVTAKTGLKVFFPDAVLMGCKKEELQTWVDNAVDPNEESTEKSTLDAEYISAKLKQAKLTGDKDTVKALSFVQSMICDLLMDLFVEALAEDDNINVHVITAILG